MLVIYVTPVLRQLHLEPLLPTPQSQMVLSALQVRTVSLEPLKQQIVLRAHTVTLSEAQTNLPVRTVRRGHTMSLKVRPNVSVVAQMQFLEKETQLVLARVVTEHTTNPLVRANANPYTKCTMRLA